MHFPMIGRRRKGNLFQKGLVKNALKSVARQEEKTNHCSLYRKATRRLKLQPNAVPVSELAQSSKERAAWINPCWCAEARLCNDYLLCSKHVAGFFLFLPRAKIVVRHPSFRLAYG